MSRNCFFALSLRSNYEFMKQIFFLSLIAFAVIGTSCNDYETVQEKLRKEKKAIDAYIDRNNIKVIKEYPADGVFGENEYFRTVAGLYINVVDSGNGRRVTPYVDEVQVRFDAVIDLKTYISDETSGMYDASHFDFPKEFIYGNTASYRSDKDYFACDGWAIPLTHVGERATVNLIIPSSLGGSYYNSNFRPLVFKNLTYTTFY
jgi:hypothetical protein